MMVNPPPLSSGPTFDPCCVFLFVAASYCGPAEVGTCSVNARRATLALEACANRSLISLFILGNFFSAMELTRDFPLYGVSLRTPTW